MSNKIDTVKHSANFIDLTGRQFGRLKVFSYSHTKNKKAYWECQCRCGKLIVVMGSILKRGNVKSCGCLQVETQNIRKISLKGKRFGRLTVLNYSHNNNGKIHWNCRCECGNEVIVDGGNLRFGNTESCGCLRAEILNTMYDLKGKQFGRLTVICRDLILSKPNKRYWLCQCNCGNKKSILSSNLWSGNTKSCGCLLNNLRYSRLIDLRGRRFGQLVVLEAVSVKNRRNRWKCVCDCGNKCIVFTTALSQGRTQSCGCSSWLSNTKPEKILQNCLTNLAFLSKSQHRIGFKTRRNTWPDFFVPQYNLAIYADGDYWHRKSGARRKDYRINRALRRCGYHVLRFWEKDLLKRPDWCQQKILDTINHIQLQSSHV